MTEYHDKYRILHKIKNRLFSTDQILILVETHFFFLMALIAFWNQTLQIILRG